MLPATAYMEVVNAGGVPLRGQCDGVAAEHPVADEIKIKNFVKNAKG